MRGNWDPVTVFEAWKRVKMPLEKVQTKICIGERGLVTEGFSHFKDGVEG